MKTKVGLTLSFGTGGNAAAFEAHGWSRAEDGYTWTDGTTASIILPAIEAPHGFFVELYFRANGCPDGKGQQRLIVAINGQEIGRSSVRGQCRLAWRSLPQRPTARHYILTLALPDATRPVDGNEDRQLGIAAISLRLLVQEEPWQEFRPQIAAMPLASDANSALDFAMRITKLTAAQLALNLESLGANCEPGFFQRKCGVEPLSLLRFSGVTLYSLVASIDDGFTGLGDRATIDPVPEETTLRDWIIYERRHLLRYHTWVRISDASRETMKSREAKRLPFLRAKLLEDLNDGLKTFVHVTSQPISDAEIWPLFLAIRRRGRGRLLVIGPSDYSHQAGMVEEIYSGLMRGYFDDFFHGQIGKISMPAWFAVCTGAWLLQHCRS